MPALVTEFETIKNERKAVIGAHFSHSHRLALASLMTQFEAELEVTDYLFTRIEPSRDRTASPCLRSLRN